jgi:hypothetical protein
MPLTRRPAVFTPVVGAAWLAAATLAHAEPSPAQSTPSVSPAIAPDDAPPVGPADFALAQASDAPPATGTPAPRAQEVTTVAPAPSGWRFTVVPYLWFAGVKSSLAFSPPVGSRSTIDANINTTFTDIFHDLNSVFMGAAEVRRGRISGQTDIIYMNISQSGSRVRDVVGPSGRVFPFNLSGKLDLDTTLWTLSGGYDVFRDDRNFIQLFAGFRYLGANSKLDWDFQGPIADVPRSGTVKANTERWDGIGGVRGESALADSRWKFIYYADAGSGGSKLTWQASGQFAYVERWGDIGVGWRYIDYQMHDGSVLQNVQMSGPILSARIHFGG